MESCKHTQKDLISCMERINAGSKYVKAGDAEVDPMENPQDYCYDIDCAEVDLSYGVVVAWSAVGYWILLRMYFGAIQNSISSMEGFPIAVKVAGLFMPLSIWVFPLLSFLRRCLSVLNLVVWGFRVQSIERYASNVWRT